jgi:hypothetical protein
MKAYLNPYLLSISLGVLGACSSARVLDRELPAPRETALASAEQDDCSIDAPPAAVALDLVVAGVSVTALDAFVNSTTELTLTISNRATKEARVTVSSLVSTERSEKERQLVDTIVSANGQETYSFPLLELELETEALEWAGLFELHASYRVGEDEQTLESLGLSFHPVSRGWALYSNQVRDTKYEAGALGESAKQALRSVHEQSLIAVASIPQGTFAHVTKVSDDSAAMSVEEH